MITSTRRTDRDATSAAVAFYGRTNQPNSQASAMSARQYRLCVDAIAGLDLISRFYDMPNYGLIREDRCGRYRSP